ncbi:MAG: hypothetical protein NTX50_19120 [Candidatus Sumerlaeota bacterium]|nr:hypothetical protein [Candidatus Sumerlaeota bacterium]
MIGNSKAAGIIGRVRPVGPVRLAGAAGSAGVPARIRAIMI